MSTEPSQAPDASRGVLPAPRTAPGAAPLPRTMRALRLTGWASEPVLTHVPVPEPRGAEVLLRVDAAGLCQSDLHVMDAVEGQLPYRLPFTLGHEVAGTVVALGADVGEPSWLGASCVVHGVWSCGECRSCRRDRDNYCLRLAGGPVGAGLGRDGGLADYVLVPSTRHLVRHGLDPVAAAPLTDAGLTAVHAVSEHLHLARGGTVLLVGAGGVGHLALQLLVAQPDACVVVVDTRAAARDHARELGAHGIAASIPEAAALVRESGRGDGVDLLVDLVGSPGTFADEPGLLAPGGVLVVVGSGGGVLELAKGRGLPAGWRVEAPFWGPRADLEHTLDLAVAGTLNAATTTFALDDAPQAYRDLRAGLVPGRAVVVP